MEKLGARLDELRSGAAYQNYLKVRDHVLRMMEQAHASGGTDTPSHYWQEELAGFEYLIDASPLLVDKLLHHSYHITGLKHYDYRSEKQESARQFEEKLEALVEAGGRDLLVPQPACLGAFGFEIGGELYNIDTLKFYEVLIGLRQSGLLEPFSGTAERRIVWEIGAGWGGFAYDFKTLFPNTSYVIVDLPQVFLFSGVYLMTLFPEASFYFHDPEAPLEEGKWSDYDFIFLPHTALEAVNPERLDLTINMVSFQEMTVEQARAYVARAHELGSPAIYSLNRNRGPYNPQMTSVEAIIGERFHAREITVFSVPYTKMLPGGRLKRKPKVTEMSYRHVVGRREAEGWTQSLGRLLKRA